MMAGNHFTFAAMQLVPLGPSLSGVILLGWISLIVSSFLNSYGTYSLRELGVICLCRGVLDDG